MVKITSLVFSQITILCTFGIKFCFVLICFHDVLVKGTQTNERNMEPMHFTVSVTVTAKKNYQMYSKRFICK